MLVLSPNFPARNTSVLKKEGPKPLLQMYQKRPFTEHVSHLSGPLHIVLSMRYSLIEVYQKQLEFWNAVPLIHSGLLRNTGALRERKKTGALKPRSFAQPLPIRQFYLCAANWSFAELLDHSTHQQATAHQ
jgi:hypothetical protein